MENQLLNKSKLMCPERLAEIIARREKIGPVGIVCNNCTEEGYTVGWVNVYQGQQHDVDMEQTLRDQEDLLAHIVALELHKELQEKTLVYRAMYQMHLRGTMPLSALMNLYEREFARDDVYKPSELVRMVNAFCQLREDECWSDDPLDVKEFTEHIAAAIGYQTPQEGGEGE